MYLSSMQERVFLSSKKKPEVFTIRGAVPDIGYEDIVPVSEGDNPEKPCVNNALIVKHYSYQSIMISILLYFFLVSKHHF